jgi:[histone H3]-lysine4 N-trimethyltransferase SETD1
LLTTLSFMHTVNRAQEDLLEIATTAAAAAVDENGNSINGNSGSSTTANTAAASLAQSFGARYRALKSRPTAARLTVRRSHIHGWGLFVLDDFAADEMIVEYMGEVIRKCVADAREVKYEELGLGSCYLFRIDEHGIVDATRKGNLARFINHCCDPNAYAKAVQVDGGERKLIIFANKPLKAGEEVTYDYKFPYEEDKIECQCGSVSCKGTMN